MPSVKELKFNLSKHGLATSGLKYELEARWKKYLGEQDELTSLRAEVLALKAAQEGTAVIDLTQGEDGVPALKRRRRDGDNGASGGDGGGSGSSGGMAAAAAAEPAAAEAAATEPAAGEAAAAEPAVAGQAAAAAPWPPADPTVPPFTIVEGPTRASNYYCHGTGYNGFPIKDAFWTIWATRCDQNPNDQYDMEPFKFPDNTPNGGPEDNIIVEIF